MKRMAVLGCGPAGLLAAYAAHLCHVDCDILSIPDKSVLSGAQYLHMEIPRLTGGPQGEFQILTKKMGTPNGYAKKVYGSADAPCSFDLIDEGYHPAWSLRDAYETMWNMFRADIEPLRVDAHMVRFLRRRYDLVICTIPRMLLCEHNHHFRSQRVYFEDGTKVNGLEGDYVVYNGLIRDKWYRCSSINGVEHTEYSEAITEGKWALARWRAGDKPLTTNCDCHPEASNGDLGPMLRVGRYGQWKKGVLTHHAFQEAMHALQQL